METLNGSVNVGGSFTAVPESTKVDNDSSLPSPPIPELNTNHNTSASNRSNSNNNSTDCNEFDNDKNNNDAEIDPLPSATAPKAAAEESENERSKLLASSDESLQSKGLRLKRCKHGRIIVKDSSKKKLHQNEDTSHKEEIVQSDLPRSMIDNIDANDESKQDHQSCEDKSVISAQTHDHEKEVQGIIRSPEFIMGDPPPGLQQDDQPNRSPPDNLKTESEQTKGDVEQTSIRHQNDKTISKTKRKKSSRLRRSRSRSRTPRRTPSPPLRSRRNRSRSPYNRRRSISPRRRSRYGSRRSPRRDRSSSSDRHGSRRRNYSPRRRSRRSHSRSRSRDRDFSPSRRSNNYRTRSPDSDDSPRRDSRYSRSSYNDRSRTSKLGSTRYENEARGKGHKPKDPTEKSKDNAVSVQLGEHGFSEVKRRTSRSISTSSSMSLSSDKSASGDIYDPEGPIIPISPGDSPPLSLMNEAAKSFASSYRLNEEKNDDGLPSSAVQLNSQEKYLQKLNRQERAVEEIKIALKPYYTRRAIDKEQYKDVLRRAVPKICHSKNGEINPIKVRSLVEGYVNNIMKKNSK